MKNVVTFAFMQIFSNVVSISNIVPTNRFHIIVVTVTILYMRNYSRV